MSKYKLFIVFTLLILLPFTVYSKDVDKQGWTVVRQSKSETHFSSIQFLDKDVGWVAGWTGLMTNTVDGGNTWTHFKTCTKENLD